MSLPLGAGGVSTWPSKAEQETPSTVSVRSNMARHLYQNSASILHEREVPENACASRDWLTFDL